MLSSPPGIARDLKRKALEKKTLKKVTFPKKPSSDGYYHAM
jgi:hypothetical protein